MGLDMYLTARKMPFSMKNVDLQKINAITANPVTADLAEAGYKDLEIDTVTVQVGYWRKANAIHKWFVDNVQGGKDECREHDVSRTELQKLLALCKQVLEDHSKAQTLLPSQSGFFFGSTDYDEWYFKDIEITVEIIEKALKIPDKGEIFNQWHFSYRSSW